MNKERGTLDTLVQEQMDADTEFQSSIADLSDDEKASAIETKTAEVRNTKFTELQSTSKKHEEVAGNYKKRSERAEDALKGGEGTDDAKKAESKTKETDLSSKDTIAIINAKLDESDVDEVVKYVNYNNISVGEALKDDTLKTIIEGRVEKRATAEATNVKNNRPSVKKATDSEIVKRAEEGDIPEPGSKEAEDLFWAKRSRKKRK